MSESETTSLLEEAEIQGVEETEIDPSKLNLTEEVIQINRVAKVVKGGRRFSFSALVVVGDKNGHIGVGFGKANEVPESIQKAVQNAKRNLIRVPRLGGTIPCAVLGRYCAARVMLRPASPGTGLIAGPAVRAVLELAGLQNVLTKRLGSGNVLNILKAVMQGLGSLRQAEHVVRLRGKNLEETVGPLRAKLWRQSLAETAAPAAPQQESRTERKEKTLVVTPATSETGTAAAPAEADQPVAAEVAEAASPDKPDAASSAPSTRTEAPVPPGVEPPSLG